MTRSVHVRLDKSSQAALEVLRAEGLSGPEAVRVALREAGARRRSGSSLAVEAAALAADEVDRTEIQVVRGQMDSLRL
jgi:hypothetical protein